MTQPVRRSTPTSEQPPCGLSPRPDLPGLLLGGLALLCLAAGCSGDVSADGSMMLGAGSRAAPSAQVATSRPVVTEEPAADPESDIISNEYTRTDSDPFSTFASDVDTASYDLYRSSLLNWGQLPDASTVRTEEFVNAFDYDYAQSSNEAKHPFSIDLAASTDFFDTPRSLLRVAIVAKPPAAFEKRPANIAFLVDTSGSMGDPVKLPLVQALLTETLQVLDPDDRVSIVTYAGSSRVALPATAASERKQIENAINDLFSGGSTAGAAGLDSAYAQVSQNFLEGGINHVVLCTDGDFNVGPASTTELVALIEDKRKTGITFTAVGFGQYPNDAMLELISNKGNGVYGIVGSREQATDYARERMLASMNFVAKNLKIQVEFNPEFVHAYRLVGYENRALADVEFLDDAVDAGEVGAGHRVTALYELALDPSQLPSGIEPSRGEQSDVAREIDASDLVLVKVRYKDVDATPNDAAYEVRQALSPADMSAPDLDLQWAGAVAAFAELLRGNPTAEPGALDQIEAAIQRQASRDQKRTEFASLFTQARGLFGE